jgi:hypothetical protein
MIHALLPFLIITASFAGGWAIITVADLPDHAESGRPVSLTFTVRQHGATLLAGLKPGVRATAPGQAELRSSAVPTGTRGEYSATLTFRHAGAWTIRIDSGFNANETKLLPLTVIDAGSPPPAPLSPAARGEHLFVAKGCIGCHRHQQIAAETLVSAGPDLTGKRFPASGLREFLANPSKTLNRPGALEYGRMPNLGLVAPELDALVAFVNRDWTAP